MFRTLVVLKRSMSGAEKVVNFFTATERMAELTAARQKYFAKFVISEVLEGEEISTEQFAAQFALTSKHMTVTSWEASVVCDVKHVSREVVSSTAASGYTRLVLFTDANNEKFWVRDCSDAWAATGIKKGDSALLLRLGSKKADWVYSGFAPAVPAAVRYQSKVERPAIQYPG